MDCTPGPPSDLGYSEDTKAARVPRSPDIWDLFSPKTSEMVVILGDSGAGKSWLSAEIFKHLDSFDLKLAHAAGFGRRSLVDLVHLDLEPENFRLPYADEITAIDYTGIARRFRRLFNDAFGQAYQPTCDSSRQELLSVPFVRDNTSRDSQCAANPASEKTVITKSAVSTFPCWHRVIDPKELINRLLRSVVSLWHRVDRARIARLLVLQLRTGTLWTAFRPAHPPGQLMRASTEVTRGPDLLSLFTGSRFVMT